MRISKLPTTQEWQERESKNRLIPAWGRVWVEREATRYDDRLLKLAIYIPNNPGETNALMVDRIRRGAAEEGARRAVCQNCLSGIPVRFVDLKFEYPEPKERWVHSVEQKVEPKLNRLEKLVARFGFHRAEQLQEQFETVDVICPASPIIQAFRLERIPGVGPINSGAYDSHQSAYRDPEEPANEFPWE